MPGNHLHKFSIYKLTFVKYFTTFESLRKRNPLSMTLRKLSLTERELLLPIKLYINSPYQNFPSEEKLNIQETSYLILGELLQVMAMQTDTHCLISVSPLPS